MNENAPFWVITPDELKMAQDIAIGFNLFREAARLFWGEKLGNRLFYKVIALHQEAADQFFTKEDLSNADASFLAHSVALGQIIQYNAEHLRVKNIKKHFVEDFFAPDVRVKNMGEIAHQYTLHTSAGYYSYQEIQRRFPKELHSFLRLALQKNPDTQEDDTKTMFDQLSGIMKDKFVLSEKHTSEHENEKRGILQVALSLVLRQQEEKMKTHPDEFLSQLAGVLSGLDKWRGKKNPLSYYPNTIKNQFLKLVEEENRQSLKNIVWLDDPDPGSEVSQLSEEEKRPLQTRDHDTKPHPEEEIETLIAEIRESLSNRHADIVRDYYEASTDESVEPENRKRPTQQEIGKKYGISDRQVRRDLERLQEIEQLRPFFEHDLKKK